MAVESWGKVRKLSGLRTHITTVIESSGIIRSAELVDINRLPSSVKDRSFTVMVEPESDGPRNLVTISALITLTVNYVKLTGHTGSQSDPLDILYEDSDTIRSCLMSDTTMRHCDIRFVNQSSLVHSTNHVSVSQTYTMRCQLDVSNI